MPYLTKNRFGVYHYRRPVPPALQPVLGRRELKCTLGTTGSREAKAAWPRAHAWAEKVLADARRLAAGGGAAIMRQAVADAAQARPAFSLADHQAGTAPLPADIVQMGNPGWRAAQIERMAQAAGISPDSGVWEAFEAEAHATLDRAAWAEAYAVSGLAQPAEIARIVEAAKAVTIGTIAEAWIDRRAARIGKKGAAEARRAAKLFGADRDARRLEKRDAVLFRDQVVGQGRSLGSAKKYIGFLRGFFADFAETQSPEPPNPFAGLKFVEIAAAEVIRKAFTDEQIEAFFELPIFQAPERSEQGRAMFWVPLIALTTGARQNEIIQLEAGDIGNTDGVGFLDINPGAGPNRKRVKNRGSIRRVPIPAILVDIGFLRFAGSRQGRLFDIEADVHQNTAGLFSKWIAREIDRVDRDPALTFHSFRHGFIQRATAAGLRPDYLKALVGHRDGSVTEQSYNARAGLPMQVLKAEIDRLNFPLDVKALKKTASRLR